MNPLSDADRRAGLVAGVASYLIWGFFPLYFALVAAVGPLEVLAHRIVWSLLSAVVLLVALRVPWGWVRTVFTRRHLARLSAASAFIAVNWLTYIWGVTNGYVVEAALGYFINPLFNVVVALWFFREPLSGLGRLGVLLALTGVVVISWENWRTLWISLLLAVSFGLYGAAKKGAHLPALPGLVVESGLLAPLAIGYLAWLGAAGHAAVGTSLPMTALLLAAGPLTLLPLWLFSFAAPRIPFGVAGVLQYLAPTVQFLLGLFVFGQQVVASYWVGLGFLWAGSIAYLASVLLRRASR